jgi:hypothetical protein
LSPPVADPLARLLSGPSYDAQIVAGGVGFTDARTGLRFEAYRPSEAPDLWNIYLNGAEECYRAYGVESALDRRMIEDGESTALFWVAIDADLGVVGGLRIHGPLASPMAAYALWELRSSDSLDVIEGLLEERVPLGVVEGKGAWMLPSCAGERGASDALARCYVHSMYLAGTRFAMCTASDHALTRWKTSGARPVADFAPVPYPDERYRTVMLWWDRQSLGELASPAQWSHIREEAVQLLADRSGLGRPLALAGTQVG